MNDLRTNPVYLEMCADCGHTQQWHIGVERGFLTGHMIPCRVEDCDCGKWAPTWGVK